MESKSKKRKDHVIKYDTDKVATNIYCCLARDFRASEGADFVRDAEVALTTDITTFRQIKYPERVKLKPWEPAISVGRFKRIAQMESVLKKYRFAKDIWTDDELEKLTFDKYFKSQERISMHKPYGKPAHMVTARARKIARRILGSYSAEDTLKYAKFGKKSSIGCPLAKSYIDLKLTTPEAFTGSTECSRWFFENCVSNDPLMRAFVENLCSGSKPFDELNLKHESLNLINVPKTWKVHRTITPLTLLSLFYSYGVGEQVTRKLKDAGLDISRLQQRHRKLVRRYSSSRTHATVDLSAASDSLTKVNLNRILPREWYRALRPTFTHQVVYGDEEVEAYTESVLPMGNGLTFPVETLIFYCIIKAIGELLGVEGVYSVYGDDIIYPSRVHRYAMWIFPQLGLEMNADKTFVEAKFRESCGADFYRGQDVRPFFLRGGHQMLTASRYSAFLYKTINGLLRRWTFEEIPQTIRYLMIELAMLQKPILRVPSLFPDTAGIKFSDPGDKFPGTELLDWSPIRCLFANGSRWFEFTFLAESPRRRTVKDARPYYWLALQGLDDTPKKNNFWDTDYSVYSIPPQQPLQWERVKVNRFYTDKDGKKRRVKPKRILTTTSRESPAFKLRKVEHQTLDKRGKLIKQDLISDWI